MKKKQKESIKLAVKDGLNLVLNKLTISKPSSKLNSSLKKISDKLADHLKSEIKKLGKKKIKNAKPAKKSRSVKVTPARNKSV